MSALLEIRPEEPADRRRVREVVTAAFGRAQEAALVDTLRDAEGPHLSLVAALDGMLVGHAFFSPVAIESERTAPPVGALGPLAVDPPQQERGVGSALVRAGLARCGDLGWHAVFLVGNPAYYARFGFVRAAPRGFTYGDPHVDPALQVLDLVERALEGLAGRVRYHPAFADTE